MDATRLIDLAPLGHVLLMGLSVACGPLAWLWVRQRGAQPQRRLHALALLTLFLTFDLVVFGAFTRLTDSGLGCPDWPGCYGQASPVGAGHHISAAQQAMPTGPVTHTKAWIEMIHRYLATGVGVLITTLLLLQWRERARVPLSLGWPLLTLLWVCLQGAFGAFTVTMKLFPAIVTLHLLGGMGLLALLRVQATRYARVAGLDGAAPVPLTRGLYALLLLACAAVLLQMALGAWVSSNYAVLACSDFPLCQGSWWPAMDFAQGYSLWRPLGLTADGQPIAFPALVAVHWVHRAFALLVLAVLALLAWRLNRQGGLASTERWVAALAGAQLLTGLSNIVFQWPLAAALAHTAGAAGLVLVLVGLLARAERAPLTHAATEAGSASERRPQVMEAAP